MTERSLHPWQLTAQQDYLTKLQRDYLLVAVPGAGKTLWAMHTARELIKARRVEKIVIVVPTRHVKSQWATTAHELGLNIEFDYQNKDGLWPPDADGVVMTYSQMNSECSLHAVNVSRRATLAIFDEVHHLSENASWGPNAREAFKLASYRMHLSGTPWNSDGQIPWVRYGEDGRTIPDATYTYQDSLLDQVNCDVFFPAAGGRAEWEYDGKVFVHSFDEHLSEQDRARRLNTILSIPGSDFLSRTFRNADEQLTSIRQQGQDRAGGLIIARDIRHAEQIADLVAAPERSGGLGKPRPVLVTSDEPGARHMLKAFASGTDRWMVSVRMASEGVDIPRLRVLIYATNYTTQLFFRQAVGRVWRGPEPPAVVYLPADPGLLKWASEIRNERSEALRQTQAIIDDAVSGPRDSSLTAGRFNPISGRTFDAGVIHDDSVTGQSYIDQANQEILAIGAQPDITTATVVAKILRRMSNGNSDGAVLTAQVHSSRVLGISPVASAPAPDSPLQSDRKTALRRVQQKLVTTYCRMRDQEYSVVNARLNEAVGVKRVRDCTEEQLQRRYELAKQWLA